MFSHLRQRMTGPFRLFVIAALLAALALGLRPVPVVPAATITVANTNDRGADSLRRTIADAKEGPSAVSSTYPNAPLGLSALLAGPSNGSFETGDLSGWTVDGSAAHVEVLQATNFIATGGTNDYDTSILRQTFTLTPSDVPATLSFDWSFLTAEDPTGLDDFDDFFQVTLNSGLILVGSRPIGGVSPYPDVATNGVDYDVTSSGGTNGCSFDYGRSNFQTFSMLITDPGTYTLEFLVADQGDTYDDSGLLVDNVQLQMAGPPNGGFEFGDLTGWTVHGSAAHVEVLQASDFTAAVGPRPAPTEGNFFALLCTGPGQVNAASQGNIDSFGPPTPTEGNYFALLCTGPGQVNSADQGNIDLDPHLTLEYDTSILRQVFTLTSSDVPATLSFDWSFLTDEARTAPDAFDDFFQVTLGGGVILGGSRPIGGVSPYPDVVGMDDVAYTVNSVGYTNNCFFGDGRNSFQTFGTLISNPGAYTLAFLVADQASGDIDSGLLVDNVRLQKSTIIVDKVTVPSGDTQSFSFTTTGSGYTGFSLTDAAAPHSSGLAPGDYSVSETVPSGWDLTGLSCTSDLGTSTTDTNSPPKASITLAAGDTVRCTFTDSKRGGIIVEKQTDPDGAVGCFTFTGDAAGTICDDGQIVVANLSPGTHTATEADPGPDFDLTAITCDDGNSSGDVGTRTATFVLDPDETVKCTFTNTKQGTISIVKDAAPDDSQDFDFSGDLGNFFLDDDTDPTLPNTATFQNQASGTYSVSEVSIPAGWNLSSIVCNDPDGGTTTDLGTATANIDLDAGEGIVCTFTNVKQGTISIVKDAVPDDSQDFHFNGDLGNFSLDDDTDPTLPSTVSFQDQAPGTYSVSEASIPAGWNLSSIVCNDPDGGTTTDVGTATANIDLDAGEGIVCTFTNSALTVETATGTGIAAFDSDACAFEDLTAVAEATLPAAGKPNLDFEHGFFSFKLVACSPGQTVNVSIAFPSSIPVGAQYWKSQGGAWYQTPVGDDDGDDVLTIQLTDGGLGDGDGLVNGEIDDPGGPGMPYGTIIVEKQTNPDGSAGSFTFSGDAAGTISDNGQIVVSGLAPGSYTTTEADPGPDFELTAITCDDGNSSGNVGTRTATFHLEVGETVKCTFTNAYRSLQVTKELELPVGGLAAVDQVLRFNITIENDGGLTVDPLTLRDDYDPWCMISRRAEVPPDIHGGGQGFLQWNNLGALAPGQTFSLWVEFTANHACEVATNTATVQTNGLSFEGQASLRILETIARVGGFFFHDDNDDRQLNLPCRETDVTPATCEPGLEEATAQITLPSGKWLQYTTNTSGWYSFNLLDPGTYQVTASPPAGNWWTPATPEQCTVTVVNTWDQVFCHFGYRWGAAGPPEVRLSPIRDATISEWEPGNQGTDAHLRVRQPGVTSALLQFDLSGLPKGTEVVWTKLRLFCSLGSNATNRLYMTAYPLDKAWVEDEVTWLEAENGLLWDEPGATSDHGDPVGWAWIETPGWVEFDLDTDLLTGWQADPASNHGLLLRGEGSENRKVAYWFFSREHGNAAAHPQLVVGYNVP